MIKFGTGKLGYSRASSPPAVWNGASLDGQYCLVLAWYGNEGNATLTTNRKLFTVIDDVATPTGTTALDVVIRGPSASGNGPLAVSMNRAAGNLRQTNVTEGDPAKRCDADKHYLAIININAGNANSADDTFTVVVFEEGSASPVMIGASNFSLNDGVEALTSTSRLVLGSPSASGTATNDAFYGPILACFMRRGTIDQATAEGYWATAGGPRIKDFMGEPEDMVFIYGQGATGGDENSLPNPVADATGACSAWFDGDTEDYATWLQSTSTTLHDSNVYNSTAASTAGVTLAHMYETGKDWSGFWQKSPPESPLSLGSVAGTNNPIMKAVLAGTTIASAPARITACTGNSRWANNTETPTAIGASTKCNRNHGVGLRLSRPAYDGGFYLPDLSENGAYTGVIMAAANTNLDATSNDIRDSDWTRFSFHGSSTSLPGNGRPSILSATGDATVRFTTTHPAEATRHGALLLNYPGGGTVELRLNVAASGTGAGTTTTPSPVTGSATVDTDTAVGTATVSGVLGTLLTVDDTTGMEPGHFVYCAAAGNVGGINRIVTVNNGTQVTLAWSWANAPVATNTVSFGPVSYTFRELPHAGDVSNPDRGVRFVHSSGGDVVIIMTGYRESSHGERLCYIPMGRGGLGYTSQAGRMARSTTFEDILSALGAECIFAGIASQDTGKIESTLLPNDVANYEIYSTPDVVNAGGGLQESAFATNHGDLRTLAAAQAKVIYLQIQDSAGSLIDQGIALQRLDANHPNGRGALDAGDLWWTTLEASPSLARVPGGGAFSPAGNGRTETPTRVDPLNRLY